MNGIFSIHDHYSKGGTVSNNPVSEPHHALPGDQILYHVMDGIVIIDEITIRARHLLSGCLEIKSNIIYGVNSKGGRYYLFRPTDPRYPPFIVLSKVKPTDYHSNIYIVITFLEWTAKYPRGNCEFIIGEIGIHSNEIINRLYRHSLGTHHRSSIKTALLKQELKSPNEIGIRRTILDQNIISIDPPGCRDIDDALHCEIHADHYLLGIHIADVDHWVPINSKLDALARERMTSIYTDTDTFHMLPLELATNHCSLLEGQERCALSLLIKMDFNGELLSYEFVPTLIKVHSNMSYDTADTLLNTTLAPLHKIISQCKSGYTPTTTGSHFLVEKAMILANTLCAQTLLKRYGAGILRTHYCTGASFDGSYEPELIQHMNARLNQAAQYHHVNSTDQVHHEGLNLTHYTHFTSPIRRYIDIINHRLLKGALITDLSQICDHANTINKQVRRFNRDLDYLKVVDTLNGPVTTEAYITEISLYSLKIFIPKYHLTQRIKIHDQELSHLYSFDYTDQCLKIHQDSTTVEYHLYSKIMVQMVAIPKQNSYGKKLRISIGM